MKTSLLWTMLAIIATGSIIAGLLWPVAARNGLEATPLFGVWSMAGAGIIWIMLASLCGRRQE